MTREETPPCSPTASGTIVNEETEEEDDAEVDHLLNIVQDDVEEVFEYTEDSLGPNSDDSDNANEVEESNFIFEEKTPERDDAQIIFAEHQAGVLCCAFHPTNSNIVASGGMDDEVYVWNTSNGNKLFTCKGHEESVDAVSFSHDGTYLATADLNGCIKIWRTKNCTLINTFDLEESHAWLHWHHGTNVLVSASKTGMIYMYKIPSGDTKMVLAPFGQKCITGKILPDGRSLACGYGDGSLKIIDLREGKVLKDVKPMCGTAGLSCLDTYKNNNLIICGYMCGSVILINSSSGKIVSVLQGPKSSALDGYIEAVAFCKDLSHQVAASGSLDGEVIIWDVVKQMMRYKFSFASCINQLAWHPTLPLLFSCHFEAVVRCHDAKAGVLMKEYMGHRKSCLNMSLSGDGSLLMTASEDKTVRVFTVCGIAQ